jgi:hypothetical protein
MRVCYFTGKAERKARFCFIRKPCLFGDCDRYVKGGPENWQLSPQGLLWGALRGPRFTGEFEKEMKKGRGNGVSLYGSLVGKLEGRLLY